MDEGCEFSVITFGFGFPKGAAAGTLWTLDLIFDPIPLAARLGAWKGRPDPETPGRAWSTGQNGRVMLCCDPAGLSVGQPDSLLISEISGRNSAMTMKPTITPSTTIIKGSSKLTRLSVSTATSSS